MNKCLIYVLSFCLVATSAQAKNKEDGQTKKGKYNSNQFSGLKFRSVGPALTSGRIADIAVNPNNHDEYYVAVASGGVWKTTNHGNTYTPIFDGQGSYSIGCVTIDPNNEHIIWVGTGENNNQRSVAYGDGIYKSVDGGKSWKNVGLKNSEHIGNIIVHPENSDIVYVSAYGPLWSSGGERGVYKTIDGGITWKQILELDEHTGVSEIKMDPRNPEVIYAAAHQRRRHVYTYVGGGPGSGIHKTTNGGANWEKLSNGLPSSIMGRIGLGISPANPDYIYAIIEAEKDKHGFYRSTNRGGSWEKMSDYTTSGNYYQELVCDPYDVDKVFSMDTWLHHTEDGGKTFVKTGETDKHVDNHCLWIDPNNTDHWLVGTDGGIYETWSHAREWHYKPNLPVTQFYKVAVDNAVPFYNIYGGTQDNNSLGGPSRTVNNHGIMNSDWYITNGGDGFESQIDPKDPNIVYAQSQYGWLVRYDKQSGETVGIKPQARDGEIALKWNWDAPLLISPHNHKRLYFAANRLYRSDNRGDSWVAISDDLTRQIDRTTLKVMGRVQSVDAVMYNKSTTMYGNIVALDESPLQEGLLYVGTDDGLIQVTEDNGQNWRKIASFPGIPEQTYVNAIICSKHDVNTVYAVFNNHKKGDFKPYLLKSTDKGLTWVSLSSNLPVRGSLYDLAEDHVNKNLLFVGTEFGCYFSNDGGLEWTQLKSGLPTIAIRDIEIQERENDLVLASFGRGFYVLDDYSPLRTFSEEIGNKKAHLFPIKDGLMFVDARPLGLKGKSHQGAGFYTAPNPEIGAVFSFYCTDTTKTIKETRQDTEQKLIKEDKDVVYPNANDLRAEDNDQKPYLLFIIKDENGLEVRKLSKPMMYGLNRIVWDFRHAAQEPIKLKEIKPGRYGEPDMGPLAIPGKYSVSVAKVHNGYSTQLVDPVAFNCVSLNSLSIPDDDRSELLAFQQKLGKLRKAVHGTQKVKADMDERLNYIKKAIDLVPNIPLSLHNEVYNLQQGSLRIGIELNGDYSLSGRDIATEPSIIGRVETIVWNLWRSRNVSLGTATEQYEDAGKALEPVLQEIKGMLSRVNELEDKLDDLGAPYTPGRIPLPNWKME